MARIRKQGQLKEKENVPATGTFSFIARASFILCLPVLLLKPGKIFHLRRRPLI
ncbi:MAG: hypothetical protein K0Q79_1604 [Flavipsychrobacter sp.]|jgi:hypothetical protein|nr:hypothetical protein [Flavipsychrobacter sp.]